MSKNGFKKALRPSFKELFAISGFSKILKSDVSVKLKKNDMSMYFWVQIGFTSVNLKNIRFLSLYFEAYNRKKPKHAVKASLNPQKAQSRG